MQAKEEGDTSHVCQLYDQQPAKEKGLIAAQLTVLPAAAAADTAAAAAAAVPAAATAAPAPAAAAAAAAAGGEA